MLSSILGDRQDRGDMKLPRLGSINSVSFEPFVGRVGSITSLNSKLQTKLIEKNMKTRDKQPMHIKRKTLAITEAQKQLEKDKANMTKKLETDLSTKVKQFSHMIKMIPDKYLYNNLKNNIIKNKQNDVDRVIKAKVQFNISDQEARKNLVYTDLAKTMYP